MTEGHRWQTETIWAIHAGRTDEGDDLFRKQNRIALGWEQMHDLSELAPTRDAFKEALVAASPDYKPGAIPNIAGQLYRFVYEMKNSDVILYPTRFDSQIHIGRVTGDYLYDPDTDAGFRTNASKMDTLGPTQRVSPRMRATNSAHSRRSSR